MTRKKGQVRATAGARNAAADLAGAYNMETEKILRLAMAMGEGSGPHGMLRAMDIEQLYRLLSRARPGKSERVTDGDRPDQAPDRPRPK